MVFPGRSFALLCFLTLKFGNTVLLRSAVMSFTLDEHPCPSTISQTQKRTRQPPLFLVLLLFTRQNTYRSYWTAGATATPRSTAASSGQSKFLNNCLPIRMTSAFPCSKISLACLASVMIPTLPIKRLG